MRWDSDHQCVFAEWKAFATSAEFQGALTRVLEVIRERAAVNFVTDTRNLESVSNEDQRWIRYNWAPLAIAAGMKRIAVIEGKHGLAKFAIDVMFKGRRNTGSQLQSRTFDSVAEAMKWVAGSA
jgi:hypothetical protein